MSASQATAGPWVVGSLDTPLGEVPRVATRLSWADRAGSWRARWAIGRMRYRVEPGLYAAGRPDERSPVLVSANYKMSFDRLRERLTRLDAWILVVETHGINVWCAAGKGTFSAEAVAGQVEATGLSRVVSHHRLVLPQLSAPGVSAARVRSLCGFRAVFGPVRAADIPGYIDAGFHAGSDMRRVKFPLLERVVLVPVEAVEGAKILLAAAAVMALVATAAGRTATGGAGAAFLAVLFAAVVFGGPALLPFLPGRAFSLKGALLGVALLAAGLAVEPVRRTVMGDGLSIAAWALLSPALSSFVLMNYTGATTFTSLSGVQREMRVAVPLQLLGTVAGAALWVAGVLR